MVNEDIKKSLMNLCKSYGWSYGVFWRFDRQNHMMLTLEGAYCEEEVGSVVDSMLLQVHSLGQGIIGGAAVDGKHRWMSANAISWDVSEFGLQFSSGIKTVAVLPLEMRGVVQLGSILEISETLELVDQVRMFLQENLGVVPGGESVSSSLVSDFAVRYELFSPMGSSQNFLCGDVSPPRANTVEDVRNYSVLDTLDVQFECHGEKVGDDNGDSELLTDVDFGSLVTKTEDLFEEKISAAYFPPPSFVEFQMDDLSQWLADSSEHCVTSLDAMLSEDTLHSLGIDGHSAVHSGNDGIFGIQGEEQACSLQNSHSNVFFGEVETCVINANNGQLLPEFGTQNVVGSMGHTHNVSECILQIGEHANAAPPKGLFSELGLEHLLRDEKGASSSCSSKSCVDDFWPPSKRRKIEGFPMNNNLLRHTDPFWGSKSMQPPFIGGQIRDFRSMNKCMPKSQSGLCVEKSHSMDAKSCTSTVNLQSKKPDEPAKKRAKPGQSKKPRPKDRQQIAERINELRNLIPNGSKLSIDALLGRTIKHMDYLQNLAQHADNIKQVHEPKLVGQGKGVVQKSVGSRGATWTFEVGSSNIVCPIIVEDLGHPRQMLIEMLCEEQEYFLEMADVVKGFGLTILKGVLEEKNGKIWAQFTVEAKKPVERVQVFMALMQIFQGGPIPSEVAFTNEPEKLFSSASPLWGNYQQHVMPISI